MSLFFGINIAVKGMMVQQTALNVASHNIANANTEGYSRQRVNLQASESISGMVNSGQLGSGVDIAEISRVREEFLDYQVRKETANLENHTAIDDTLQLVETIFMEPSETGFNQQLDNFWNAWQELSKTPESSPVRTVLKEAAVSLTDSFRQMSHQLSDIQNDIQGQIQSSIKEVNSIAEDIARLNDKILYVNVSEQNANDLLDKRDLALDRLAALGQISVSHSVDANGKTTGTIEVKLGEFNIVDADGAHPIDITDLNPTVLKEGRLAGLMQAGLDSGKSNSVQFYLDKLNTLALGMAQSINDIHKTAMDLDGILGEDFFVFEGQEASAANIQVNPNIEHNVSKIAAAQADETLLADNGDKARQIADLKDVFMEYDSNSKQLINSGSGNITIGMFYKNMITELGSATSDAGRKVENQQALVEQTMARRESVKGVAEDEEIANVVLFQHAFNASAKIISVIDEMLNTIINGLKA